MKISFGKYKDRDISEIPSTYLRWYISTYQTSGKLSKEYILCQVFIKELELRPLIALQDDQPRITPPPDNTPPDRIFHREEFRYWHELQVIIKWADHY